MIDLTPYLTDDLRRPEYRGHPNPLRGHCYVACEVLHHLSGGRLRPSVVRHDGGTHWFLTDPSGVIIDPTAGQFDSPPPYESARRCGFLTRSPSKRAQRVLAALESRRLDNPSDPR